MKKMLILSLALLTLPRFSHAEWVKVLETDDREILLDDGVKRSDEKTIRLTYRTREKKGNFSADLDIEADCSDFTYRVLKGVWTEMKTREEVRYPDTKIRATPRTDVYAAIKEGCERTKPRK
jgi:hypothetical protein